VSQLNFASASGQRTRYVAVHANGAGVYLTARTIESGFLGLISRFRLKTIRSVDGGSAWSDASGMSESALRAQTAANYAYLSANSNSFSGRKVTW